MHVQLSAIFGSYRLINKLTPNNLTVHLSTTYLVHPSELLQLTVTKYEMSVTDAARTKL